MSEELRTSTQRGDAHAVITIAGEVDIATADRLLTVLDRELGQVIKYANSHPATAIAIVCHNTIRRPFTIRAVDDLVTFVDSLPDALPLIDEQHNRSA